MAATYQQLFDIDWANGAQLIITKMKVASSSSAGTGGWLALGFTLFDGS